VYHELIDRWEKVAFHMHLLFAFISKFNICCEFYSYGPAASNYNCIGCFDFVMVAANCNSSVAFFAFITRIREEYVVLLTRSDDTDVEIDNLPRGGSAAV
jgi:hypothetical protein